MDNSMKQTEDNTKMAEDHWHQDHGLRSDRKLRRAERKYGVEICSSEGQDRHGGH